MRNYLGNIYEYRLLTLLWLHSCSSLLLQPFKYQKHQNDEACPIFVYKFAIDYSIRYLPLSATVSKPRLCSSGSFWSNCLHIYFMMVVFLQSISLHRDLLEFVTQLIYHFSVLFVLLLQNRHIFFLALSWIFSRLAVALELFLFWNGDFILLVLSVCHIVILLLYVLSWLHKFGHFVSVKYFLLLLGPGFVSKFVFIFNFIVRFFLHFLVRVFRINFLRFVQFYFAEISKNIVALMRGVEILKEGFIIFTGEISKLPEVHILLWI